MKTKTLTSAKTVGASGRAEKPAATRAPSQRMSGDVSVPSLLQIKSILVPIDFSEPSRRALEYAVPLAEQFGAKLTLLHVVEPVATPDFVNSFPLMLEDDKVMAACKEQLESLVLKASIKPKNLARTLVRQGRAFHEIAAAAESLKVDLILISTHGYTGLKHVLLGSTTERVVRHAPCPVLVVREKEPALADDDSKLFRGPKHD